jgi:hypothetical protein
LQFLELFGIGDVGFRGDDDHGFLVEAVTEALELIHYDAEILDGIGAAVGVGDVDEVDEDACALDVTKKLGTEAGAEMRAFDEAGDIRNDEAFFEGGFADGDDAELRLKSGERVVGDFGASGGDA